MAVLLQRVKRRVWLLQSALQEKERVLLWALHHHHHHQPALA
jgi:hypothetical protein